MMSNSSLKNVETKEGESVATTYSEENFQKEGASQTGENENFTPTSEPIHPETYSQEQYSSHIRYLLSKSKLGLGQRDHEDWFKMIEEIYRNLDAIPIISSVLKVLEYAETLEIIFDFATSSIVDLDPTQNASTSGSCDYKAGRLYVGAKSRDFVLGTLAHELTHLAMQIIYNNDCNPYNVGDISSKMEFEKIVEDYRRKSGLNPIISRVFTAYGNPDDWPSELIVRVPHLLGHYYEDPLILAKLREEASELFDFYERNTQKDVLRFIEMPNHIKNQHRIQRLNSFLGELDVIQRSHIYLVDEKLKIEDSESILLLASPYPQLAKLDLVRALSRKNDEDKAWDIRSRCIFTKIDHFTNDNTLREIHEAHQFVPEPILVIDCAYDYNLCHHNLWKVIDTLPRKRCVLLIVDLESADSMMLYCDQYQLHRIDARYTWENLASDSQKMLLSKELDFQGFNVTFHQLISASSSLCDVFLEDMLKNKVLALGRPILSSHEIDAYRIQRIFVRHTGNYGQNQSLFTSEDLFLSQGKVVILSDDVGMGKTGALVNLSKLIKTTNPSCWISKLNLIDFVGVFEDYLKYRMDIDQLLPKMLDFESEKEEKLFEDLFKRGQVVVMLDNFDELESSQKKIVTDLIQYLRSTPLRQLWITTRPEVEDNLEKLLDVDSLRLQPFSEEDQINCLINFWKSLPQSSDPQNSSQLNIFAKRLLEIISETINDKDLRFAGNPLHVRMLAESFQEELLEFLNPKAELLIAPITFNLFFLYDKFIDQKYTTYVASNSNDVADILTSGINVRKVHQLLALEVLFPKEFEIFPKPKRIHTLPRDKINRIGIAQYAGNRPYFAHRTFGEYFVADLIANRFSKTDETFEKFFLNRILLDDDYRVVRGFLDGLFEEIIDRQERLQRYAGRIAELWRNTCFILERNLLQPVKRQEINFGDYEKSSIATLKDFDKMMYRSSTECNLGGTILHQAIQESNENIAYFLLNTFKFAEDVANFLLYQNQMGQNIWYGAAISGNQKILKKVLETVISKSAQYNTQNLKHFFSTNDQNKHCPWHWIPYHNNVEMLQLTRTLIKFNYLDLKDFFQAQDIFGRTIGHWTALYGTVDILNGLWKLGEDFQFDLGEFLNAKDHYNRSIWHFAIYNQNVNLFINLWALAKKLSLDFKEDVLLNKDITGKTLWELVISMEAVELFKNICILIKDAEMEIKQLLLYKNERNQNALHWTLQNKHPETLTALLEFITTQDLDQCFIDEFFFCEDNEKGTIWHLVIQTNAFEKLEKLWSWLKSVGLGFELLGKVLFDSEKGILADDQWMTAPSSEYQRIIELSQTIAEEIGVDVESELFLFECSELDSII
ncbi:hypothetical protein Trydic_g23530 [Trypoxylus dichotomus]